MNELKHKAAFEKALTNYRPAADTQALLAETKLVLLLAATASGRNTIIRGLIKTGHYHFVVSDTTRAPRSNDGQLEKNGREYWFRSEAELLSDVQQGEFLEAEIIHGQQVSGTSIREIKQAHDEHRIAITDIDIGGVQSITRIKPDTLTIVVLPPSFEEWQRRIFSRGDMLRAEHLKRVRTALSIFKAAMDDRSLKLVINSSLQTAVQQVDELAEGQPQSEQQQLVARQLAKELYEQTAAFLATSDPL